MKKQTVMLGMALGMALTASPSLQAATSNDISVAINANKLALSKSRAARLKDFYTKRNMAPAWGLSQLVAFSNANFAAILDSHGLEAPKYTAKISATCPADLRTAGDITADCELALSEAVLRSMDHIQNGQLDPASVDFENVKMSKKVANFSAGLSEVLDMRPLDLAIHIDQQAPQHSFYQRHKQALARFNAVKAQGGAWKALSLSKKKFSVGSKDAAIVTIKNIMRAHGYSISDSSNVYTAELELAVRDLQKATLLPETGRIESTNTVLFSQFFGIDLDRRIARLKLDLEKFRWMPNQLESSFIFVGLGEQELTWFDSSAFNGVKMQMKTINGKTDRRTPMMRDVMNSVILNPPWTVPPGILAKDKLPTFQKQTYYEMQDYFNTNHYTLVDMNNSRLIDPLSVNWSMVTAQNINFYIRQRPGLHNALGVFKFNLTNPYAIYLHDTNSRNLFSEPMRLLSSGCVRLERPQELAEEILRGTVWDRSKIEQTIAQFPGQVPDKSTTIALKAKLPVYLMYMTSSVKADGIIRFHPDYYGMNAKMLEKLDQFKNEI